jgi:hypothetical protein
MTVDQEPKGNRVERAAPATKDAKAQKLVNATATPSGCRMSIPPGAAVQREAEGFRGRHALDSVGCAGCEDWDNESVRVRDTIGPLIPG